MNEQSRNFVTGATGFLGRALVRRLRSMGHAVTVLARNPDGNVPAGTTVVRGDMARAPELLAEAMHDCDAVFHLAALITFDPRRRDDLCEVNGEGTRRVLAAAKKAGVARTVFVSSACTAGVSRHCSELRDERSHCPEWQSRRNPYLASKQLAERFAAEAAADGQDVVTVNPTTVIGAGDDSLNAGTLVRQVAESRLMPVPSGGTNVVAVDDVIDGFIAAWRRGQSGSRYILGGANVTFADLIAAIGDVVGRLPLRLNVGSIARWPMMGAAWAVQRCTGSRLITPQIIDDTFAFKYYSSEKAESELGWFARRTLNETLRQAWDYYERHGLIRRPMGAVA